LPVVLMTAHGSEDIAFQALQKGAASYVPKRNLAHDLPQTIGNVLAVAQADRRHQRLGECLTNVDSRFVLDNDPSLIPPLIGHLEDNLTRVNLCDPGGLTLIGIAVQEALANAVFRGNLEVGAELFHRDPTAYHQLVERRRHEAPYRERRVYVSMEVSRLQAMLVIRDEGPGFDPDLVPDPTDPANLDRVGGRGLFLIRTFMDRVEHNETGNQITMVKRRYR